MERELGALQATLDEERRLARAERQRLEAAQADVAARERALDERAGDHRGMAWGRAPRGT